MKIEVNLKKRYFFILLAGILLLAGLIFAYAYTNNFNSGNPAAMGHSSDEVNINISGQIRTLQQAIDSGLIGNQILSGFAQQYVNAGEDTYAWMPAASFPYETTSTTANGAIFPVIGTVIDTCDGNHNKEYVCPTEESKSCMDVLPYWRGEGYGSHWALKNVTCKRALGFIKLS